MRMDNAINSIKPLFYYLLLYSYFRQIKVKMQANIDNYYCDMKLKFIFKSKKTFYLLALIFISSHFSSCRMRECSLHGLFSVSLFPTIPSAGEIAKVFK